jgi:hypothetical protein
MRLTRLLAGCCAAALLSMPAYAQSLGGGSAGTYPGYPITTLSPGAADESVPINAAFPGRVVLTCGTFTITNPIAIPSLSDLEGSGPCTIIKGSNINLITNANTSAGNGWIYLHDLQLSFGTMTSNAKLAVFQKASQVSVHHVIYNGDGTSHTQDDLAFVGSDHYLVENNWAYGSANACFDNWGGSHDFVIHGNHCVGNSFTPYGVLVNGLDTNDAVDTTYNGVVSDNDINSVTSVGVWAGGLYDAGSGHYGVVRAISIKGNIVDTVTSLHGIEVSDGIDISVVGNILRNLGSEGIRVGSQNTGTTSVINVSNNIIDNANVTAGGFSAIHITGGADHVKEEGNLISGSSQVWDIIIDAGVTANTWITGVMAAGTSGEVSDSSTGPTQMGVGGTNSSMYFTTPNGMSFGISGVVNEMTLDTGGNLYLGAPSHTLGNTANAIGPFYNITRIARGAAPTLTGSCATNGQSPGNQTGEFHLNGACSAAGTVIMTFANAGQNGWFCKVTDKTTPADTFNQTTQTVNSVTLTTASGGAASDAIGFDCGAY